MAKIIIDPKVCKGCGLCTEYCPKKILRIGGNVNAAGYAVAECIDEKACIGCGCCYTVCPDCAITVTDK